MKRNFLQNSVRRMAFVLAMLLLLGGTPVQAAENTTACKNQQPSMESRVCPLLLPPGNSVTLSAEYLEMRLGLPAGEIAAITITSLPKQSGGRLMLDGVEVQMYDTILRSELDRLCYVQDDSAQQAGAGWFRLYSAVQGKHKNLCDLSNRAAAGHCTAPVGAGCLLLHQRTDAGLYSAVLLAGEGGIHRPAKACQGQRLLCRWKMCLHTQ